MTNALEQKVDDREDLVVLLIETANQLTFLTDPDWRSHVRAQLWQSRRRSPLWNVRQFARDMEEAYRQMWERHVDSATETRS